MYFLAQHFIFITSTIRRSMVFTILPETEDGSIASIEMLSNALMVDEMSENKLEFIWRFWI